ncbi:MAG: FAD-binding oxidoreductase [Chloroflexi bacterium]|nr:FAD-binding oxidoreductase [Chloroflexota bacterium]
MADQMAQQQPIAAGGLALDPESVQDFMASTRGQVLRAGDDGFDPARMIWNGMIDRTPALIVRCTGAADVIGAVNYACEHNLLLAVRGGGHSASGTSVCDRGLMIDLSAMKGIRVEPARGTARAEPGLTWGEFDRETQAFGLATTGGVVSSTGIAGLTLGGGIGWLGRTYGLSCDNLLSVDIVTADGQLRTASAEEHADLFWAVRGGGGNLGVVTSFEYRLHRVGPMVYGGLLVWPRPMARDVLRLFRDFTRTAPENASAYAALGTSPDGIPLVVVIAFLNGPSADGEKLFQPLRAFGPPVADLLQPMPYTALQQMLDALNPPGNRVYWKSAVLQHINDDALEAIIDNADNAPSPLSSAILEFYGGATNRVGIQETAYPLRDATYALNAVSMWTDPGQDEANIRWSRGLWDAMQPFSPGSVYVNFLGDEGEDRVKAAYGPNYTRLAQIKAAYDPTNLFRLNQNIKPAVERGGGAT